MSSAFIIVSFLSMFHVVFVKCQRLQPYEMWQIIRHFPEINKSPETRKCFPVLTGDYHPEIHYEFIICDFTPDSIFNYYNKIGNIDGTRCSGFQCWESKLTIATKIEILDIFNTYRQTVARGTCNPRWCAENKERLIFRMTWDESYEEEASIYMNYCTAGSANDSIPRLYPVRRPKSFESLPIGEFFHVVFQVKTGFQSELRAKVVELLDGNYLSSWDKTTKQFRRGLATGIGCLYIVRYGVTMDKTDLNERVEDGNVAHFGCYTAAMFSNQKNFLFEDSAKYLPYAGATSTTENCNFVSGGAKVLPDAWYSSLCYEGSLNPSAAAEPSLICQPDAKIYGDLYNRVCSGWKSTRNAETWNEKPYGFYVRWSDRKPKPECYLPELPVIPTPKPVDPDNVHTLDFDCTLKHQVSLLNASQTCLGWTCDDSQLTDETRQYILNSLNEARHLVAQGLCSDLCSPPCNCSHQYCNVMKLRWHWYLESKAMETAQNCPTRSDEKVTRYEDSPIKYPAYYEEVSLLFELPSDGQIKLPEKIGRLFWTNGMNDWNTDGTFRRGNAAWIGCAIVIRLNQKVDDVRPEYRVENGTTTHMVCIFVSLDENFVSKKGLAGGTCCPTCTSVVFDRRCRLKTAKKQAPFPFLCSSVLTDITMSCAVNKCPEPHRRSLAWKLFVDGETIIEHHDDTRERIYRISPKNDTDSNSIMRKVYSKKICKIIILLYLVTLSVVSLGATLYYKYYVEKTYYAKPSKSKK